MCKIDNIANYGLVNESVGRGDQSFYIIKMADTSFSTAGVPFSKCSNKKLILNIPENIYYKTSTAANAGNTMLNSTAFGNEAYITVTACGTQVQTVVGGSISFSA